MQNMLDVPSRQETGEGVLIQDCVACRAVDVSQSRLNTLVRDFILIQLSSQAARQVDFNYPKSTFGYFTFAREAQCTLSFQ